MSPKQQLAFLASLGITPPVPVYITSRPVEATFLNKATNAKRNLSPSLANLNQNPDLANRVRKLSSLINEHILSTAVTDPSLLAYIRGVTAQDAVSSLFDNSPSDRVYSFALEFLNLYPNVPLPREPVVDRRAAMTMLFDRQAPSIWLRFWVAIEPYLIPYIQSIEPSFSHPPSRLPASESEQREIMRDDPFAFVSAFVKQAEDFINAAIQFAEQAACANVDESRRVYDLCVGELLYLSHQAPGMSDQELSRTLSLVGDMRRAADVLGFDPLSDQRITDIRSRLSGTVPATLMWRSPEPGTVLFNNQRVSRRLISHPSFAISKPKLIEAKNEVLDSLQVKWREFMGKCVEIVDSTTSLSTNTVLAALDEARAKFDEASRLLEYQEDLYNKSRNDLVRVEKLLGNKLGSDAFRLGQLEVKQEVEVLQDHQKWLVTQYESFPAIVFECQNERRRAAQAVDLLEDRLNDIKSELALLDINIPELETMGSAVSTYCEQNKVKFNLPSPPTLKKLKKYYSGKEYASVCQAQGRLLRGVPSRFAQDSFEFELEISGVPSLPNSFEVSESFEVSNFPSGHFYEASQELVSGSINPNTKYYRYFKHLAEPDNQVKPRVMRNLSVLKFVNEYNLRFDKHSFLKGESAQEPKSLKRTVRESIATTVNTFMTQILALHYKDCFSTLDLRAHYESVDYLKPYLVWQSNPDGYLRDAVPEGSDMTTGVSLARLLVREFASSRTDNEPGMVVQGRYCVVETDHYHRRSNKTLFLNKARHEFSVLPKPTGQYPLTVSSLLKYDGLAMARLIPTLKLSGNNLLLDNQGRIEAIAASTQCVQAVFKTCLDSIKVFDLEAITPYTVFNLSLSEYEDKLWGDYPRVEFKSAADRLYFMCSAVLINKLGVIGMHENSMTCSDDISDVFRFRRPITEMVKISRTYKPLSADELWQRWELFLPHSEVGTAFEDDLMASEHGLGQVENNPHLWYLKQLLGRCMVYKWAVSYRTGQGSAWSIPDLAQERQQLYKLIVWCLEKLTVLVNAEKTYNEME